MRKSTPIFYSALMLTGVNLLLRMVSTGFQVYLSGRIGAEGMGLMQLVLSVGALAMTAGSAGVRTAAMYLTAEELGRRRAGNVARVLSCCLRYSLVCSGGVAIALYAAAAPVSFYWIGQPQAQAALRLFAAFLPVTCLCGVMTGYFTAEGRIGALAAVEVAEQLFAMSITLLTLGFWAGSDPAKACRGVIFGSGCGACLTLLLLTLLRQREQRFSGPQIPVWGRLARTALPLAGGDLLRSGINTTENLMVPRRLALYAGGQAPLAAYGTVCGMVFPVIMFPAAILYGLCELLIPELARCRAAGSHRRIRYLARRSLAVALVYGCFFAALLFSLAEPVCLWLFDDPAVGKPLRLFAPLIPMLYCDALTDAMTKGLGQQLLCLRYNITTAFLDVVFLFFLLPRYGMAGYFISFFVTHLLNFILSLRRLLKITGCRLSWFGPVVTLACTVFSVWAASFLARPFLRAIACWAVLGCLLFLTGCFGREELNWLAGLIRKKRPL